MGKDRGRVARTFAVFLCFILLPPGLSAAERGAGTPDGAAMLRAMDDDGDGRIAREEFRGPPHRFGQLDRDGDGFLGADELATIGRRPGGGESPQGGPVAAWYERLPVILTHTHLAPGSGEGQHRWDDWDSAVANALREMDANGVRAAVILPTPKPHDRRDADEFDRLVRIAAAHPGRFLPAGGGATLNGMIEGTRADRVDEGDRRALAERAGEIAAAGGVAFGETTALHFSFFSQHPFEETPPDHPLFLHLADLAARHGVPLDLHMEAVARDWRVSGDLAQRSNRNPERVGANIAALERLLAHNRAAKIIWVHLGMDTTGQRGVDLTRRLLRDHPNLYLSVTSFQSTAGEDWFMRPGDGLNPRWRALIVEFPDRVMIGSDTFFLPDHPTRKMPKAVAPAVRLVRAPFLPPAVARKVAFENAQHIFGRTLIRPEDVPLPAGGEAGARAPAVPAPPPVTTGLPSGAAMVGPRGLTAHQTIANMDGNGDGRVARDEFAGPPKAFGPIDANGDGFLAAEEFEARWRALGSR